MKKVQYLHSMTTDRWDKVTFETPWWAYLLWKVSRAIEYPLIELEYWAERHDRFVEAKRVKKPKDL